MKDPKPSNYDELVKKYRKVQPVVLEPTSQARELGASRLATTSGLTPYSGEWTSKQITHLLKRTLFGFTKSELVKFSELSMDGAVSVLMTPEPHPEMPINNYSGIEDNPEDPDVPTGQPWPLAPHNGELEGPRIVSYKGWILDQMLSQDTSIHQKLNLFWHNLLVTQSWDIFIGKASYQYFHTLHENAFGNYKKLILEITKNPAMLFFLNGAYNHKDAPDENYARELQELFTVGKGPDSKYTEEDVVNAARILTGWTIRHGSLESSELLSTIFRTDFHDRENKSFSSFYNNQSIEADFSISGIETEQLIEMIFETDECAKYLCRRLYNFFVNPVVDERVETNVITPLADILRSNNYDITPVLQTLLRSEHFYDTTNIGVMIKSPVDFMIGTFRTLGYDNSKFSIQENYQYHASHMWTMANMGMEIGDPPSVAGWPAYYQAPQYDKSWITTDTILRRAEVLDAAIYWGFWINPDLHPPFDLLAFMKTLDDPSNADSVLEELSKLFLGLDLQSEPYLQLKRVFVSIELNDAYWAEIWNAYENDPSPSNTAVVVNRINPAFQLLFQLGEFHLM